MELVWSENAGTFMIWSVNSPGISPDHTDKLLRAAEW